jgi:uncharacterized membrane protein SpoIIM required for sporulation
MLLEALISPEKAKQHFLLMFFIGFFYSSLGILLSLWIFRDYASLVMVFLTVLACAPLIYRSIKREEKNDCEICEEISLLKEHGKTLRFFIILFLGITVSCMSWYVILPAEKAYELFNVQSTTISQINGRVTGSFAGDPGLNLFSKIFLNNIKVLIFSIMFALLFGFGAIFILVWNASVIGVAMGNFIRDKISLYAQSTGFMGVAEYFHIGTWGFMRYAFHGIPEILAYFIGGLAGGIIYFSIVNHDFTSKKLETILMDASNLIILAIVILFVAGLMEVYITPLLF